MYVLQAIAEVNVSVRSVALLVSSEMLAVKQKPGEL